MRCNGSATLVASTTAVSTRTTPDPMRIACKRSRTALMRDPMLWPATPKARSGIAMPTENVRVNKTSPQLRPFVAASTVMEARIGPAHGTNTSPNARPMTNPLPSRLSCGIFVFWKGRSRMWPTAGMASPTPTMARVTIPAHRSRSSGKPTLDSRMPPSRVKTAKLVTSPPTTTTGRLRDRAPSCNDEVRMAGSTGSTQGLIAVMMPETMPTMARVNMTGVRCGRAGGWVRYGARCGISSNHSRTRSSKRSAASAS